MPPSVLRLLIKGWVQTSPEGDCASVYSTHDVVLTPEQATRLRFAIKHADGVIAGVELRDRQSTSVEAK